MFAPILFIFYLRVAETSPSLRVLGGRDANPDEFPYVVALERLKKDFYRHICTGSALTPSWTLTAAHCTSRIPHLVTTLVIRYMSKETPKRCNVLKHVLHNSFLLSMHKNDIGLVKNEEMIIAYYAKLSAVDYSTFVGSEGVTVGYGVMNMTEGRWRIPQTLQVLNVMFTKCDTFYIYPEVCTTPKCGGMTYLCSGDSGGPIIHHSRVVAIHTVGVLCGVSKWQQKFMGDLKYTGVDTPISPYIEWILKEISEG